MGFFTADFMKAQRNAVLNRIDKMQYKNEDGWQDADISSKEISNNSVIVRATISPTGTAQTITEIRITDTYGVTIGTQEMRMTTSTNRSKLIMFECPIQEV